MYPARRSETVRETVRELRTEAKETNERRVAVFTGEHDACCAAAKAAIEAATFDGTVVSVSEREIVGEHLTPKAADRLLGTTHDCVVMDCHDTCLPNALGQATGTIDGGGLLILLFPPLERWLEMDGGYERLLTAPPFTADAVGNRFKRRLVGALRRHRGIAIIDIEADRVLKDGRTDPASGWETDPTPCLDDHSFPAVVYGSCRTADQRDAVYTCEHLLESETAVVLEADRGRGKSSAAGFAAAALAIGGTDTLVTAPTYRNAAELFDRAAETLETLGSLAEDDRDGKRRPALRTTNGGAVRFQSPQDATADAADVLFVDEAAALSVQTLESLLSVAPSTCFTTTVRGYEGAGRGFDVRFRDRLENRRAVETLTLSEPIRYAPADPVEVWLFHVLLLGATPPPASLVSEVSPEEARYERLDRAALTADEPLLGEVFGLLVAAHYRTEPNDLARLLDAPNVAVRALTVEGHVVSVALLSREGGLDASIRRAAYEGERIAGNLVPDLLTSQLRDSEAAVPVGLRVMRIATHDAVRSNGFGSKLLEGIEAEFGANGCLDDELFGPIDYLSTSYGATPALLRFWTANGYRTVHLSSTRNETSGEHSGVMLRALSPAGQSLAERHAVWFRRRIPDVLADPLDSVDPDVVRGVLGSVDGTVRISLSDFEWRLVASAAYGPGQYGTAPGPFGTLALKALLDGAVDDPETERLLVVKVLQRRPWEDTAEALGYVSKRACMRALGEAFRPIVEKYGTETAREEAARYR